MTNHNDYAVQVENLYKRFPGIDALAGVCFSLPKGEICGLLGPNGSGKSTLLKCLMGLLSPDKGEVRLFGKRPSRETKAFTAYLPEIDHLYPWMKVGAMIDFVGTFYKDWNDKKADELTQFMKLSKSQKVGTLSKGMRARLKLVITMAREARLILLDEPLSGLDPASRGRIAEVILSEYKSGEQTMILSTHEVGETESMFDSVIFLDRGKVKFTGQAEDLREVRGMSINDLFKEVYA